MGERCVHVSKGEVGTSKKSMMSSIMNGALNDVSPTPISVHRTNIDLISFLYEEFRDILLCISVNVNHIFE